jgi:ATP-dependent DNA ligase
LPLLCADHIKAAGIGLFQTVCALDLEGIVAKRKGGTYPFGGWLKIKNPNYTQAEGRHEMFTKFRERRGEAARIS